VDKRKPMLWDIFCRVIDNYGDIGVCWRLAVGLAARGDAVRLWADDLSALQWMAPGGHANVQVMPWPAGNAVPQPGDVVIEAFGCELPPAFMKEMARGHGSGQPAGCHNGGQPAVWINLEYLSAESFAERAHGLPSPVMSGPAAGLTKYFYYPGFTPATGGLLREDDLRQRQAAFDRSAWLAHHGIAFSGEMLVSLFCYEPPALPALLDQLEAQARPARLLVTPGRAERAVRALTAARKLERLAITYLPAVAQTEFDELLRACELNFVRGEDSLVRALWAGVPFVWQIYPQQDGAHLAKLDALLDTLELPGSMRRFHHAWNTGSVQPLPELDLRAWGKATTRAASGLWQQPDLVTQLLGFVQKKR
jgi:uncharacterized repeat protein (TIGR03837 family)